jgi:hypothetical protein
MLKSKNIVGSQILCEYESTNIQKAMFDTNAKLLEITFNSGSSYVYEGVSHEIFVAFNAADSQGKYFNQNINKKFNFKKK